MVSQDTTIPLTGVLHLDLLGLRGFATERSESNRTIPAVSLSRACGALTRHDLGASMRQHRDELRTAAGLRLAFSILCVLVTLAVLNVGLAGSTRAQQCDVGNVLCEDNQCYPLGSQCCSGGGACNAGYNCWRGTSAGTFCCPGGTHGTNDGYCVPDGFQYCGSGHYCVVGYCCSGGCCTQK